MKKKCAVVCSQGLGDGLIFLTLSKNLYENGYEVDTFHPLLFSLQRWFPHLPIRPFPKKEEIPSVFSSYEKILINSDHTEENCFVQAFSKEKNKEGTRIFHVTTCRGKNLPGDVRLDITKSMVTNLLQFCEKELKLNNILRDNGLCAPQELFFRKERRRVIIHPTSRNEEKNWPAMKFVKLALRLKKKGYDPCFFIAPFERKKWEWVQYYGIYLPTLSSLDEMASFLYESSFFIGTDSGVGHLASCMGIPTLSVFGNLRKKELWRPDWNRGRIVLPSSSLIPNWKGFRLREKYWKPFLRVNKVFKEFLLLAQEAKERENL